MSVPTNLIPTPITSLPEYTGSSTLGYMPYVIDGQTFKVQFTNIAAVGAVPSTRVIASGTGLAGGGDLSADRVISIAAGGVGVNQLSLTGVTAGTYGSGSAVPVLTVDATGRVTSVTTAALSVTGFVPTSRTITAGNGLTGGGSLASDITLSANFSATTPLALGSATAGVAITLSRGDHVHPALDLSDTNQTQGALPLGRGGTGDALSPVAGAVVYSTGTKFALSALGSAGQVLVSNGTSAPSWLTLTGTGTVTSVNLTAGTGISVSGGPITAAGSINVVNTAPDQVVSLTGAGTTVVTGTYPSFTITSTDSAAGTVTSVNASGGTTGLSFTGGPITTSGTLTLGGTLAIANGGTGAIDAPTALTNLGAYPASNPSGFTSNVGTVTSVSGTGTVSGLSLSGTVTSAGSLTLGGTLAVLPSNFASQTANTVLAAPNGVAGVPTFRAIVAADVPTLNQNTTGTASNVTGIVAVANGGTGQSSYTDGQLLIGNTTGNTLTKTTLTAGTNVSITNGSGAITINATDAFVGTVTSVAASGGTTGLSFTGSPITTSGTLTLGGTLAVANGGTGTATAFTAGSVVFAGASGVYSQDNGELFWDDTNNRLGIGTASPAYKLDVNGAINVAAGQYIRSGSAFLMASTGSATNYSYTGSSELIWRNGADNAELMRLTNAGNVGIGTSSPGAKLEVNGDILTSWAAASTKFVGSKFSTTYELGMYMDTDNRILTLSAKAGDSTGTINFKTGLTPTERMRIDSSGNVGINTSAPGAKLETFNDVGGVNALRLNTNFASGNYVDINPYISGVSNGGFSISLNGTIRQVISDTGNVGIGTSSPQRPLHVYYGSAVTGAYGAIVQGYVGGYGAGVSFQSQLTGGALAEMARITADGEDAWNTTASTQDAGLRFYTSLNGTVAEKMRIDSSGNLLVGTTTVGSGSILTAVGSNGTDFAGITARNNNANVGIGGIQFGSDATYSKAAIGLLRNQPNGVGSLVFYNASSTGAANWSTADERMRIDSSGQVGIGTSSPGYRLDVAAADTTAGLGYAARLRSNATATAAALQFTNSVVSTENGLIACTDAGRITIQGSTDMAFRTNGSERARIDSSGYLLVGTTTASAQISVTSNTYNGIYSDAVGAASNLVCNKNNTAGGFAVFSYNGSGVGSITTNGTTTAYNTSSDSRLKENIADADNTSNLIDALQVRKFDWKADGSHQRYGFIAQELVEVAPEAVSQPVNPDDMMGVDYSKLVPMLIKEVQSLRARVAQLEGN